MMFLLVKLRYTKVHYIRLSLYFSTTSFQCINSQKTMRMVIHFQQCLDISACFTCCRFLYKTQNHVCCVTDSCMLCHRFLFALSQTHVCFVTDSCLLCLRLVFTLLQTCVCCVSDSCLLSLRQAVLKRPVSIVSKKVRHLKLEQKCVSCE